MTLRKPDTTLSSHPNGRSLSLAVYDLIALLLSFCIVFGFGTRYAVEMPVWAMGVQVAEAALFLYTFRFALGAYRQIWRFADVSAYIRLMEADLLGGIAFFLIGLLLPFPRLSFIRKLAVISCDLLCCFAMRLIYQFLYMQSSLHSGLARIMRVFVRCVTGAYIHPTDPSRREEAPHRIKIAIVGAGRTGSLLAQELCHNEKASYLPVLFIDKDPAKVGRQIQDIPIIGDDAVTEELLKQFGVQEIVLALPQMDADCKKALYDRYRQFQCMIKLYDYPVMQTAERKNRQVRPFAIEDLLFREPKDFTDAATCAYYADKVVLISGGGGSIGSEMCRQIAKMHPKQIVLLDVYENGAYDVQQELRISYGSALDLRVEIATVCDRSQLRHIFAFYHPDIVIHAAAHKHVPLMEHNCCEAVRNNVFGTLNIVEVAEEYGVSKFIMVSTDKAVNPTNVMGATKRMCEMIVQSRTDETSFSATRFGNVLGSNGSVIPLFKRQIANGGPITLTDRRIIRYFMTIPEASQLVLQSGAMAKNGELYVLDMGKPIKILELAENMVQLSGFRPYVDIDIIETGLREGEKLYEELLIQNEELIRTDNEMIFVERDTPLSAESIRRKLEILRQALETEDDDAVRNALHQVIPTFHTPEEVNADAVEAKEMAMA